MKVDIKSEIKSILAWVVALIVAISLLSSPAIYFGHRNGNWFAADYFALFAPPTIWVALTSLRIGHQSLSHIIELLALVLLMPVLVSIRVFAAPYLPVEPQVASLIVIGIGVVAAIALRLFVPFLPE